MKKKKKSVFLFKQPVQASLNFLVGSIILGLTCFIIFVSAAPPASPYAPGATLTPDCAPGDPNCTVYAPLATSLTADTAVTMSDYALNFDSGTLYVDALNNRVGIGTTSPYAKLAVAGQIVAEYFTATSTSATSTFASQLLLSRIPDTPHTFASWATGAANSQVQNSSFYINPASAIGDTNLFGAAVSDSVKFLIDAEGDVFANSITLAGGSSLSTTTISTLTVENSANLGDAPNADSHIIKGIVNLYATSSSPALSIWNSSSGDILQLLGGAATPQNYLTLTSAGNLGLGTTTPYAKLAVVGRGVFDQDVRADYFTATSTTASSTLPWLVATRSDLGTVIKGTWNGASIADGYIDNNITINGGAISGATNTMSLGSDSTGDIYYRDSSGYLARLAIGTGGYVLGSVSGIPGWVATTTLSTISGTLANTQGGTGQDSSAWNGPISAANGVWSATTSIGVQYGGTGLTSAMAGYALIGNTATALSATSSLFISTAGNVGIGTTTPNSLLNIASTLPRFYLSDTDFATNGHWFMENDAGVFSLGTTSSALAVSGTRALSITNAGNVGIGTTGPLFPLHLMVSDVSPNPDLSGTTVLLEKNDNFILNILTPATKQGAIYFSDINNNGMGQIGYDHSADALIFRANAVEKMRILGGTGNVGIGTTTVGSLLHLSKQTAADTDLRFESQGYNWIMGIDNSDAGKFKISSSTALGTSDRLTIDGSGNVGIGTTTPNALLNIASTLPRFYLSDTDFATNGHWFMENDAGVFSLGTTSSALAVSGTRALSITNAGNVGIGTTVPARKLTISGANNTFPLAVAKDSSNVRFAVDVDNNGGAINQWTVGGVLTTYITSNGSSYFNAGNVGIGTTNPGSILALGGTAARIFGMDRNTTAATAGQGFTISSGGAIAGTADLAGGDLTLKSGISTGTGTSALHFYTATAGVTGTADNAPTEKLTILGSGNVGIGTTTPNSLLSLYQASADTALTFGNSNVTMWTMGTDISDGSKFKIASSSALGTSDRLTIDTNGNVGIGTTTPNSLLNIASTLPRFYLSDTDFATNGHWFMENDAGVFSLGTTSSALAVSGTRALSITNAGNVGIGTTGPGVKLDVVGASASASRISVGTTNGDASAFVSSSYAGFSAMNSFGFTSSGTSGWDIIRSLSSNGLQLIANADVYIDLDDNNNGTNSLFIRDGADNKIFVIQENGNVGIGTTSPGALFSVQGNGLFSGNIQVSGINATSTLTVQSTSATSTFSTGGLTVGTSQFVVQQTSGNVGIGTTTPNSLLNIASTLPRFYLSDTDFAVNGHWFMENDAGVFSLGTTSSALAVSATRALSITNAGNVGIGTTGPLVALHLYSAQDVPLRIETTGTAAPGFDLWFGGLRKGTFGIAQTAGQFVTGAASNDFVFRPDGSGNFIFANSAANTQLFKIMNTGNVGIGTTTPGYKLTVNSTDGTSNLFQVSTTTNQGIMVITNAGNVGIGTTGPNTNLSVYNANESTTLTNFTQALTNAGIEIQTDYTNNAYTPGIFWSTINNNATKPKAGIWIQETGEGSYLNLGTSNNYPTGITNQALVVDPSGNVGIGTTSPGALFSVQGNGLFSGNLQVSGINATSTLTVQSTTATSTFGTGGLTVGTSQFVVQQTSGNVGIGTTGPNKRLHISGIADVARIQIEATDAGVDQKLWQIRNTTGGDLIFDGLNDANSAVISSPLTMQHTGNVGIGTTTPTSLLQVSGATPKFYLSNTSGAVNGKHWFLSNSSGDFSLGTTSDSLATNSTFLTVKGSTGNVGIGTTAPTFPLHVVTSGRDIVAFEGVSASTAVADATSFVLKNLSNTNGNYSAIVNRNSAGGYTGSLEFINVNHNSTGSATGDLRVVLNNAGSYGERLRITGAGNVGIGTTTPSNLLDIYSSTAAIQSFSGGATKGEWSLGYDVTNNRFAIASSTSITSNVRMVIDNNGNVGIGTTSPYARLSVVSGVTDNSDVIAVSTSTSGAIFRVTGYGNVVADGTITGGGADYAEYFYSQYTNLMPGETVCIDLLEKNAVKRCYRGHDNNVMGIVSTKPSILGNSTAAVKNDPEHYVIIGMLGQVDAFVSAENGPINIGDSLTSASSTPGYAMRADSGDSTVGVALEPLAAGKGKIKVLISRRNKSLAVEEVESLVVERIANMKIEDQVQAMIKQAVDNLNLDPKIQAIAQQEANKLDAALTVRLDDVDGKIFNFQFSIGNEFSKINDQMNALASGLYITNSQGQVIFSGNREIGALPNREVALTADSILLNGNVGIGTTSPWSMLSVNGTITQTNQKSCSAGLTTDANGAINGCVASDVSLKIDIASSTYDALSIIAQLAPVNYKWRNSLIKDSLIHSGFIAQEVAAVFPTAVLNAGLDENGKMMLGVDPNAMASLLVKGLQELNASILALSSGLYITDSQGQAIFPNNLDIASTAKNIILNGNVGIGVSSPKFKLDVAGNINSTGLCLNGVCKTSWDQLSANFSDSNLQANSGSGALTQNFALDENGYLALGKIKASELKTQKLTMDNNTGEPAIGNGVIKLNATSTVVINKNIEAGSKIFITWRENLNGADFWICSQISKESFSVCLDRAAATSTPFDYWIVGVDENKNPPNPLYQGGIGETPPSQALSETPVPVAEQITPPALETSVSNTPAEIAPAEIQPPLPPLSGGSESAPAETAPQETPAPEAATITEQVAPALPPTVSPEAVPAPEASPVPAVDTTTGN